MSKLLKSLTGFAVLSTLAFATTASADCASYCSCATSCTARCYDYEGPSTCGGFGICSGLCMAAPQVSMNEEQPSEDAQGAQDVCTEAHEEQSAEQAQAQG